jgi:hypothetical protein
MHSSFTTGRRAARLAPLAVAALATAAFAAPAGAQTTTSPIALDAAHDSVTVNGLGIGQATLQVTRPDAMTGKPVVIGQYSAFSFPGRAFTVNTTAPSALLPNGDCWQAGGISLPSKAGLVPDMLPGDSVSIAGQSVTVPSDGFDLSAKTGGPITGCDTVSTWGRNMVTSAAFANPGSDLTVSGQAQPLATGVQVTATDGKNTSTPVDATMGADGAWTAKIPASDLAGLSDGSLNVNGIYAVPDVASGTAAHILGRTLSVDKQTPAAAPAPAPAPAPAAPARKPSIKLSGLLVPSKLSLRAARAGKLKVSFVVPTAAKYVRVRLARPGHTALLMVVPAAQSGTRQTVRLSGAKLRNMTAARYTVTVGAGARKTQLGNPVLRAAIRIK